jgi:hypothetical protein
VILSQQRLFIDNDRSTSMEGELDDCDIGRTDGPVEKKARLGVINKQPQFQCICSWEDCYDIYSALTTKLRDDDPWTGNPIVFDKRNNSAKVQCLKHSIFHHLGIKPAESIKILNQSLFVVRRHHWPRELLRLSLNGNISDLIFRENLRTIDITEGYSRLLEECNKYHIILKKLGIKLKRIPDPRQHGKRLSIGDIKTDVYIRAPVVDHRTARLEAFGTRKKILLGPTKAEDLPVDVPEDESDIHTQESPADAPMPDDGLINDPITLEDDIFLQDREDRTVAVQLPEVSNGQIGTVPEVSNATNDFVPH